MNANASAFAQVSSFIWHGLIAVCAIVGAIVVLYLIGSSVYSRWCNRHAAHAAKKTKRREARASKAPAVPPTEWPSRANAARGPDDDPVFLAQLSRRISSQTDPPDPDGWS